MTYRDWYIEGLYSELEVGGDEATVDRLVNEINKPTCDGLEWFMNLRKHVDPRYGFIGLISGCSACGEDFAIPRPTPTLDQEFLCPTCMKPVATAT